MLALSAAFPAAAQLGPQLAVTVLPPNSPPSGASVSAQRMLSGGRTHELLLNGFPAAMRFRLELWREGKLFDKLEASQTWDVLVRYDAYAKVYQIVQRGSRDTESRGFPTRQAAEEALERPVPVSLAPLQAGQQYYFNVVLDIETLSVTDLDELQRWLSGDFEPVVRGRRAPIPALRRGIGTLLSRLLGGERRHYEARVAFRS